MKDGWTNRVGTLCLIAAALASASSLVEADADHEDATMDIARPWQERAVTHHLDTDSLEHIGNRLTPSSQQRLVEHGKKLFSARFTTLDGVGRPLATQAILPTKRRRPARTMFSRTAGLDANACSSCHFQPFVGGAGDFSANVFVSEGFNQSDFDTTDPQFSNERNTNHLFGAGLVELLAREMTRDLQNQRRIGMQKAAASKQAISVPLSSKGVTFGKLQALPDGRIDTRGIEGVDIDLVVRPFSHKGVMTSLRQFTINALNHHHGMQAEERFGARWTGEEDHDGDGVRAEITAGDVSALVAWQATLPPPAEHRALSPEWQAAAERGRAHFDALGCSDCHRPSLPLDSLIFSDPGPVDSAGTLRRNEVPSLHHDLSRDPAIAALPRDADGRVLVPLYGDLKRHAIADAQVAVLGNELLSQRFVERDVFMTSELWGVASTAPYGHRGDLTTLASVIDAHGGDARTSRDAWQALEAEQRDELIAFLKTLVIAP